VPAGFPRANDAEDYSSIIEKQRRETCGPIDAPKKQAAYLDFLNEIVARSNQLLSGFARRTDLRLDDPLASSRSRLRAMHLCLRGHVRRRNGRQSHPQKRISLSIKTNAASSRVETISNDQEAHRISRRPKRFGKRKTAIHPRRSGW
jgi:hypothetical protein